MSFAASIGLLPLGLFVLGAGKRLPARRRNGVPCYAARGDFHWPRARPGTYARGGHPSLYPVSNGLTYFAALLEREGRAEGGEGLQRERIPRIGRQAHCLRQPHLLAYDVRAQHHRDHLVLRMAAAHAFASHPAIGGDHHPLGRDVFQRLADDLGDLIRPLDLQSVMIDDADHDLLVSHCPADRFEIAGARGARFEGQRVGIDLIQRAYP